MAENTDPHIPWLRVACIVRSQGRKGEVIADLLTDFPERFTQSPSVHLRAPGAAEPARKAEITASRLHAGRIVLSLSGSDSIESAEALRGYDLVIPWEDRMPLSEDEIYIAELTGATLHDRRTGQTAGVIRDVDRESSNSTLLVLEAPAGTETLVPFVKAYAPDWNAETRVLSMDLPDGLLNPEPAPEPASDTAKEAGEDSARPRKPRRRR